uniref:Uncharacterized protein n=1 Tax=Leersia perrieri TaxID=77586 RepID=A0A0D9W9E2_9ORYZ
MTREGARPNSGSGAEGSKTYPRRPAERSARGRRRSVLGRSLDYPCVLHLRFRRLLSFLDNLGYLQACEMINERTALIFDMSYLVDLVEAGECLEALFYVFRFAPYGNSGVEARTLLAWYWFLDTLKLLHDFAHGINRHTKAATEWFAPIAAQRWKLARFFPLYVALASHFVNDIPELAMDMLDRKQAKIAERLAYLTPEIRGTLNTPRGTAEPADIFPILGRRHVKPAQRAQPSDLARFYLEKKKRSNTRPPSEFSRTRLLSLIELALHAGERTVLNQLRSTEYFSKQDIQSVPVMQTMLTNSSNKDDSTNMHPPRNQGQQYESSPNEGVGSIRVPQPIKGTTMNFDPFNFHARSQAGSTLTTFAHGARLCGRKGLSRSNELSKWKMELFGVGVIGWTH